MAATIEFVGDRLTDAESITNWGITKFTGGGGSWSSPALDADSKIQGSNCITWTAANTSNKAHYLWFDQTTANGTSLNFSSGGTNEGQLIYMWAQHKLSLTSSGLSTTLPGMALGLASNGNGAANTAWWNFYSLENYPGGWVRLVLDPRKVPTASGASFDLSDVDYIGVVASTTAGRAVDVFSIDAIDLGSGIRYSGSGVGDSFDEIISSDLDTSANVWGVVDRLEGTDTVIALRGNLFIGDSGVNTYFSSQDKVVPFDAPRYFTGAPLDYVNSCQDDYFKIFSEYPTSASGLTDVEIGVPVGVGDNLNGRNGILFLGNSLYDYGFQIESGVDRVGLFGTTIRSFDTNLVWSGDSNYQIGGCSFDNNGQFQPQSGIQIRNTSFLNASGSQGSLLWASGMDIKNCSFINNAYINTSGVAIEHPESLTVIYDGLLFSNNDYDIYFSPVASGDLTINATNGSDPLISKVLKEHPDSAVSIINTITLTLTGLESDSEVRVYTAGTTVELDGSDSTGTSFVFSFEGGDPNVDIRIFHLDYQPINILDQILPASNASIPIQQIFDRNYENP